MSSLARLTIGALLAIVVVVSGCKKIESQKAPEDEGPPPMSKQEEKRGRDACTDFKERVCKCASEHPDDKQLEKDCGLADARTEAIDLSVRISSAEGASGKDRAAAISNARRVVQRCIERSAELAKGCVDPSDTARPANPEPPATEPPASTR